MKIISFISAFLLFPGFLYSEKEELDTDLNTGKLVHTISNKIQNQENNPIKEEAEESLEFESPLVFII